MLVYCRGGDRRCIRLTALQFVRCSAALIQYSAPQLHDARQTGSNMHVVRACAFIDSMIGSSGSNHFEARQWISCMCNSTYTVYTYCLVRYGTCTLCKY